MNISPQLQALLILKDRKYIGDFGLPKYAGFHAGTHRFILYTGDELKVDLVTKTIGG